MKRGRTITWGEAKSSFFKGDRSQKRKRQEKKPYKRGKEKRNIGTNLVMGLT